MSFLVISGTDTDVGKTIVTAALAALARADGAQVAVVKPVQTGVRPREQGDLDEVRRLSGVEDLHELARLPDPLAPATAARRSGADLPSIDAVVEAIRMLGDRDLVLVEGAGGLLVHLDAAGGTLADLARELEAPVLVVARAELGTLNHAGLTCEAIRARGLTCLGVVIGSWPANPTLAASCNIEDLPAYADAPLLGMMPERASELDPAAFLAAARGGLGEVTRHVLVKELSA